MTLGNGDANYGYNAGLVTNRNPPNSLNTLLTDKDNFGYNQWSILRFAGFNNKGTGATSNVVTYLNTWTDDDRDIICISNPTTPTADGWGGITPETLRSYLQGTNGHRKVDIFMIGFDTYYDEDAASDLKADVLIEFVKTGGILMICSERSASNARFLNRLFGTTTITSNAGRSIGTSYTLGFNPNNTPNSMRPYYCTDTDPILTGPFGNILGRSWGEDASTTQYLLNIPLDSIVIYSGARSINDPPTTTTYPANGITIFRHAQYPFIFIGDGGFNSNEAKTYQATQSGYCPFTLRSTVINGHTYPQYPYFRTNFGPTPAVAADAANFILAVPEGYYRVDNTTFTANAFAWCIMKAEEIRRAGRLNP